MKIFYPALFRNHSGVLFQEGVVITAIGMASSEPAYFFFFFNLGSQNGQDCVMPSSCPVTYVSMNMSLTRESLMLMKVKPPHSFIGQSMPVSADRQ